jgi:WXG100 family type VII secretion target
VTGLGLTFSRAEDLSASLGAAAELIGAAIDDLEQQLSTLSGQWSGSSAEAYQQASASIAQSLAAMNAILRQAEKVSLAVAQRHRETETRVQALWE